jgi:hypothetical protein
LKRKVASSRKLQAASFKPQASSHKLQAESFKPQASSRKLQAESQKLKAESNTRLRGNQKLKTFNLEHTNSITYKPNNLSLTPQSITVNHNLYQPVNSLIISTGTLPASTA